MRDATSHDPIETFWGTYFSKHQASEPFVADFPIGIECSDVFDTLMNSIACREATFNCGGVVQGTFSTGKIPNDLSGYEQFMRHTRKKYINQNITFTRDFCLQNSNPLTDTTRKLFAPFVRTRGVSIPGINAVVIGGIYQSTWIGLHNDHCDTFLVPLIGSKEMHLWPPGYFAPAAKPAMQGLNGDCLGHRNVGRDLPFGQHLTVKAGQILHIPAGWWHYNLLPCAQLTLTLSIGVFSGARRIDSNIVSGPFFDIPDGGLVDLNDYATDAIKGLEEALTILKIASGGGVIASGADCDYNPNAKSFRLRQGSNIYLVSISKRRNEWLIFSNYQFATIELDDSTLNLVAELVSGNLVSASTDTGPSHIAMEWLQRVGAVEVTLPH